MARQAQVQKDPIAAAREVAQAEVARRWPALAAVEPIVTPRQRYVPEDGDPSRIGADSRLPSAETGEYTFTFAHQSYTPEGYSMPSVARVTVDAQRRVVKATVSKG